MTTHHPTTRAGRLHRLGAASARHPGRVVVGWLTLTVGLAIAAATVGGTLSSELNLSSTESQRAVDLLTERYPELAGGTAQLVFHDEGGLADPAARAAVTATVDAVAALPDVVAVTDPLAPGAARSPDGATVIADVHYAVSAPEVGIDGAEALEAALRPARDAGIQAEAGGEVPFVNAPAETGTAELVGLGAAVLILAVGFGSLVAMGLPVATALLGLALGSTSLLLLAGTLTVPAEAPAIASMIGIGVGIDYALFVVTRFREHLAAGYDPVEAAGRTTATAGAAVVFAGVTVMIAILGLFLTGVPLVGMLGLAAALVVGAAVLLAVTLLPALLGWLGPRVDRFHLPGLSRPDDGALHGWARWSHRVSDRPWPFLVGSVALLGLLAVPVLSLRLGMPDAGNSPTDTSVRRAYDLVAEGFGPGVNGPLLVVATLPAAGGADQADNAAFLDELEAVIAADPAVAAVGPPAPNAAGDTVVVTAIPVSAPQDAATADLVHRLRGPELDGLAARTGTVIHVGGGTATFLDLTDLLADRMPLFFATVIGLSFLLLVVVFRSVLVPLKAVVLNLLSIGAAYGVVVAVFQWGWGRRLIGLDETVPIVSFIPIMMFAILFGLSMDYHVFLLSRIREGYLSTGDPRGSVADGLAATARVITSAALVMVSVFVAFVFSDDPMLKMFGLGLAVAVLLDATVVRLTLVPSTMALLGHANWWLPGWLDRILPHLDLEGSEPAAPLPPAVPAT